MDVLRFVPPWIAYEAARDEYTVTMLFYKDERIEVYVNGEKALVYDLDGVDAIHGGIEFVYRLVKVTKEDYQHMVAPLT